ncbi:MAG TPA: hypothetical protein VFG69_16825, partial [Nannocystaceae bacterium]|nr:hypothetical protein [Nannocystaceae bacterium]
LAPAVEAPAKPELHFTARTKKGKPKPPSTPVSTTPPESPEPDDGKLADKPDIRRAGKDTPGTPSGSPLQ